MRYDGPPGLMLDLVPASPDGVDLEWIHPYTYAQPYVYANNNPLNGTDPSGLAPKKLKIGDPEPLCKIELCCGKYTVNGVDQYCPGTNPPQYPCHCYIRFTDQSGPTEYHGFGVPDPNLINCPCGLLTCGTKLPVGHAVSPDHKCDPLNSFDSESDCIKVKRCLDNRCKKTSDCYGYCLDTNSNSVAYMLTQKCSRLKKPSIPGMDQLPTAGTGCDSDPIAPGWGKK